jgi:large conductance mechanosensitive channel
MIKGFKEFIFRGNVVELAVAVIIGGAFGAIIKSLVEDVFTPLIGMVVGKPDFSSIVVGGTLGADGKIAGGIMLGNFLNAVIGFLLVAIAVYLFIVVPLKKYQALKAKEPAPAVPPAPPEDVALLREIRDLLQRQQK